MQVPFKIGVPKQWKEYMESELLGIVWVKVIAKNILLESLGIQRQAVFAM